MRNTTAKGISWTNYGDFHDRLCPTIDFFPNGRHALTSFHTQPVQPVDRQACAADRAIRSLRRARTTARLRLALRFFSRPLIHSVDQNMHTFIRCDDRQSIGGRLSRRRQVSATQILRPITMIQFECRVRRSITDSTLTGKDLGQMAADRRRERAYPGKIHKQIIGLLVP